MANQYTATSVRKLVDKHFSFISAVTTMSSPAAGGQVGILKSQLQIIPI